MIDSRGIHKDEPLYLNECMMSLLFFKQPRSDATTRDRQVRFFRYEESEMSLLAVGYSRDFQKHVTKAWTLHYEWCVQQKQIGAITE